MLLSGFCPDDDDIVSTVTPHKTFNTARGVVYCSDLHQFEESEILKRCPKEIISVRKLKGTNNAIQLTFFSHFLPEYVKISRIPLRVKKFKQRPVQCRRCFEYGHINERCNTTARCYICSGMHALDGQCTKEKYCFHCNGAHSPNWRECPFYKFEQDVLEVASNEHISFGAAKRKLRRDMRDPLQTYASASRGSAAASIPHAAAVVPSGASSSSATETVPSKVKDAILSTPEGHSTSFPRETSDMGMSDAESVFVSLENISEAVRGEVIRKDSSVKNKIEKKKSDEGFVNPPKNKRAKRSSPKATVTEVSNPFNILHSSPLEEASLSDSLGVLNEGKSIEGALSSSLGTLNDEAKISDPPLSKHPHSSSKEKLRQSGSSGGNKHATGRSPLSGGSHSLDRRVLTKSRTSMSSSTSNKNSLFKSGKINLK